MADETERRQQQEDRDRQQADREKAAQDARSKQTAFNPVTGVIGPHDFDGTSPEDIRKMAIQRPVGSLPLGPGQVTGGQSITGGKANVELPQPSGGDRTPGQGDNPDKDTMDRTSLVGTGRTI